MLHHHVTLQQIRNTLLKELGHLYPEGEATSLTRIILEHAGYPSTTILRDPHLLPGSATFAQIKEIVSEIHTGKPIQYILGYTFFCELRIQVNHHVLIPRPETEELTYRVINECTGSGYRILDIGTGSGCIALALKKNLPDSKVTGMDNSHEGLKIAEANGRMNDLEIEWILSDMMNETVLENEQGYDLIVSNPPYVLESERSSMKKNVLAFEPVTALFVDDTTPLIYYERIAQLSRLYLNEGGAVWVEINEQFGNETASAFTQAGFTDVVIFTDIHEKERFIRAAI